MIYITGDTHTEFSRIVNFCNKFKTKKRKYIEFRIEQT